MIEAKYLVVRKDGTVPAWGSFVLSYDDPATPVALRAYAQALDMIGGDPALGRDIMELVERLQDRPPTAPTPEREPGPDVPAIVRLMKGEHGTLSRLKLADVGLRK